MFFTDKSTLLVFVDDVQVNTVKLLLWRSWGPRPDTAPNSRRKKLRFMSAALRADGALVVKRIPSVILVFAYISVGPAVMDRSAAAPVPHVKLKSGF